MQEVLVLSIDGMHCGACVRRVTDALAKIEGVQVRSVEVGLANVVFDPEYITVEKIAGAVIKIGFAVRPDDSLQDEPMTSGLKIKDSTDPSAPTRTAALENVTIPVTGMTCAACQSFLQRELSNKVGVGDAHVSLMVTH